MILKDKEGTKLIIQCDCGREAIELSSFDWKNDTPKEYFISLLIQAFYTEQDGFLSKLINRLKLMWNILRYGVHQYTEICLTEKEMKELKEIIKEWE